MKLFKIQCSGRTMKRQNNTLQNKTYRPGTINWKSRSLTNNKTKIPKWNVGKISKTFEENSKK